MSSPLLFRAAALLSLLALAGCDVPFVPGV